MNETIITNLAANPVAGHSVDLSSPLGAFMLAFVIVIAAWGTGWALRTVRFVGHDTLGD